MITHSTTTHLKPLQALFYTARLLVLMLFFLAPLFLFSQISPAALPVFSSEDRDKLTQIQEGMVIYNSTTHCINYYGAGLWRELCGRCAAPPQQPTVLEIMPFYNSITIRLKNDGFAHQLALMPAFTLLPDTSNKRVIVRDINADFQQIMLLNVNDCGSSEPMMLDNIRFAEANPCGNNPILTDTRDGNEYRTYAIGNQCWTTTNLRYGNADNKQIFLETDNENKLYNWNFGEVKMNPQTKKFETMPISTNVCPAGWHVPTSADFQELITFYQNYGSPNLLRNIFKSQENAHIYNKVEGKYEPLDEKLMFWGATNADYDDSKALLIVSGNEIVLHFASAQAALPIRCLKNK